MASFDYPSKPISETLLGIFAHFPSETLVPPPVFSSLLFHAFVRAFAGITSFYVMLGKFISLSEPQFSHFSTGGGNNTYLLRIKCVNIFRTFRTKSGT